MSSLEQRLEWRRVDHTNPGVVLHAIAGRREIQPGRIARLELPAGEARYLIVLESGRTFPNLRPGTLLLIDSGEER
jgi:hypothetical protein